MMNNGKNTLDDQIRAALEHFEQPYNAEHWHDMNAQLDALNAADASFDASLRERLTDISVLPMAGAWSKMAEQLDNLDAADSSFDAALRGRLADVTVAPAMGDWSKMAAALDDFEDTDAEFDEVLRRKLENITTHYPNHWAMMNERLDREFTLKGKIVRYKIIEAALMLLALFTVINAIDWNTAFEPNSKIEALNISTPNSYENNKNDVLNIGTPNSSELDTKNDALKPTTPIFKTPPQSKTNDIKSFDNSTNWRERGGIQDKNEQNNPQGVQNSQQNQQPNQQRNMTPTGQPIVDNSAKNVLFPDVFNALNPIDVLNTEGGTLTTNTLQNTNVATVVAPNSSNDNVNSNQTLVEIVPSIDILQANLLTNNKLDATFDFTKTANADKKGKWRLSTFGTAALDWVTTSFVYKREQHFQQQGVANYGVNALVAYKHGKVELETGIMINRKKYSIANAEVTTGSVVLRDTKIEKPQDIRLSIISIPLNLNVTLKQTRRWNIYTHTGIATNAIVDALDRRIKEITVDPNSGSSTSTPPSAPSEVVLATYSKGLINGGETKENVFLTTHIGIGLEYKLTPKTSLFIQPTASFIVNKAYGIGTLNDRVKTYSIQGGAKWRL